MGLLKLSTSQMNTKESPRALVNGVDGCLQLQSYKEKRAKVKAKQEQLTATKLTVATLHAQQETDQLAGELLAHP